MIYFIQDDQDSLIKIGTAVRLKERLKRLEVEYGQTLRVLGIMDGNFNEEQELHNRFLDDHVEDEWFKPTQYLMVFIGEHARPWTEEDDHPPRESQKTIAIRCTPEFKEWLEDFRRHCQSYSTADFVFRIVIEHAERVGFRPPPHRRKLNYGSPSNTRKK